MGSKVSIGLVGLGHIGGSLALATRDHCSLLVFDSDKATIQSARRLGLQAAHSLDELLKHCGIILFATPNPVLPHAISELLVSRRNSGLASPLLIVDVASTKVETISSVASVVADHHGVTHLSLHPMAGREGSGFDSANPEVLYRSRWAETSSGFRADPGLSVELFEVLSRSIDFELIPLLAKTHDTAVAAVSHLPHVLAEALGLSVGRLKEATVARLLAAGSFTSATRVANGIPERIAELCWPNRVLLYDEVEKFIEILTELSESLRQSSPEEFLALVRQGSTVLAGLSDTGEQRTEKVVCKLGSFWESIDVMRDSGQRLAGFKLVGDMVSFDSLTS